MHKKILVIEQSDAIRSIAETLLHQQGYDVLSASTAPKAKELILSGEPNMLIIGADIKDTNGQFLYDSISELKQAGSLPFLLIEDPERTDLPYPPEIILPRPFDPDTFIERVRLFIGEGAADSGETVVESDPFASSDVDDEFLDSALGLDKIEIEESEEVDKTEVTGKLAIQKKEDKKKDIFELAQTAENGTNGKNDDDDSGRVESLMIRETETGSLKTDKPNPTEVSKSSKIELDNDQYGMTDSPLDPQPITDQAKNDQAEIDKSHDYDWFINEMKKDTSGKPLDSKKAKPADNEKLVTSDTRDGMETIGAENKKASQPGKDEPIISPGGVDKFISDFKKEIGDISSDGDNQAAPGAHSQGDSNVAVKERVEIDPQEFNRIAGNLIEILAEKLAKKIIERIDKDEIALILKDDLQEYFKQLSK